MENKTNCMQIMHKCFKAQGQNTTGKLGALSVNLLIDIPYSAATIPKYLLHSQTT